MLASTHSLDICSCLQLPRMVACPAVLLCYLGLPGPKHARPLRTRKDGQTQVRRPLDLCFKNGAQKELNVINIKTIGFKIIHFHIVKLGLKEQLNSEQIGIREQLCDYQKVQRNLHCVSRLF